MLTNLMRNKAIIISLILLIAINTAFLWERLPSGFDILLTLLFGLIGLILIFVFTFKLGRLFVDKFKNKENNISVIIIGSILTFCFLFPFGLIRQSIFDPPIFLSASREGAANCTTNVILGTDNSFIERSVCFGVDRNSGTYKVKNDTVFLTFENQSNFGEKESFGIIERVATDDSTNFGFFHYFRNLSDSKPMDLIIRDLK